MKAYTAIWKLRFIMSLQYRTAAIAGMTTQLFFGFVFIMIMVAFYSHSTEEAPISLREVATYIWLTQAFLSLVMLWFRDGAIFSLITSGNIAYELCRPCSLYPFWFAKMLAQRVSGALLRCLPILLVAFALPEPYRLMLPPSVETLVLFALSLLFGLLVVVAITMLIHISVFWTMSPTGSMLMIGVVGQFFAGMIIPVPLMPKWMQTITDFLPFRWTMDFPFRVYSGHIPQQDALWGIAVQLAWLVLLVFIGRWALSRSLQQVVIQGG
jgi:ABC-2 type transport system permease protein